MASFLMLMGIVFIILLFLGAIWLVTAKLVEHDSSHKEMKRRLYKLDGKGKEDRDSHDWY